MKGKSRNGKRKGLMPLSLFVLLAIAALLAGTVTAVQGAEAESVTREVESPLSGEVFWVTLTINGELPLVVGIVETIPSGFSFPSSGVSTTPYSVSGREIAFAVIDEKEIKYKVIAPSSGEGTFTGTWADINCPLSKEKDIEIGSDSDVIVGSEAEKESAMVFEDMDVSMIALKTDKNVSDVKVMVERIERTPDIPEPSGISYAYLDMKVENAEGAKVEGRVEFKIMKSWLVDNNIDEATVKLNRYDENEGWNALPTIKVGEDDDFVYFEAETPGFSTFAVTGEKKVEVEAVAKPTPAGAAPTPAATPSPTPASKVPGFEAIFAAVSLLIVYTKVFRKKGKGGDR
jgi:PGF-pre-PGF domain-containing protein